jgi:hypothetical protein
MEPEHTLHMNKGPKATESLIQVPGVASCELQVEIPALGAQIIVKVARAREGSKATKGKMWVVI